MFKKLFNLDNRSFNIFFYINLFLLIYSIYSREQIYLFIGLYIGAIPDIYNIYLNFKATCKLDFYSFTIAFVFIIMTIGFFYMLVDTLFL